MVLPFLTTLQNFLTPYREYFVALFVLILFYFIARLLYYLFDKKLSFDRNLKKNAVADELLRELELPLSIGVMLAGSFIVFRYVLPFAQSSVVFITKVFFVLGVFWAVYFGIHALNTLFRAYAKNNKKWNNSLFIVQKVTSIVIYILAALLILSQLGVQITPLLASLGIGGLAVALALQSTLANYFAGLYISSDETIRLGDFIELDEKTKGYVQDISWRSTKIQTFFGNVIIIPNSRLADTIVTNYSEPRDEIGLYVPLGVQYDSDLAKVEKVSLAVARRVLASSHGAIKNSNPLVSFKEFGPSSINFGVTMKVRSYTDRFTVRHDFMKELVAEYRKQGISFAFPSQSLYFQTPLLLGNGRAVRQNRAPHRSLQKKAESRRMPKATPRKKKK